MTAPQPSRAPGFGRLDIARAVALMVALVIAVGAALEREDGEPGHPRPVAGGGALPPIASEANVFRLRTEALSVAPDFAGNGSAHVRSEAIYRRLRAYPGAPPRIPHGLTAEEFEGGRCNGCHERGGWVARFGSYAPVTPHPEFASCLQCHVPSDALVDRPLPASPDALVCDQCHVDPDASPPIFVASDWRASAWPTQGHQALDGSPHLVPHDIESRNNCLACHSGPGTVVGLRTDHPERVNCRQCHVPLSPEVESWLADTEGKGGAP